MVLALHMKRAVCCDGYPRTGTNVSYPGAQVHVEHMYAI